MQDGETKRKNIEFNLERIQQIIQDKQRQSASAEKVCNLIGESLTLADLYLAVAVTFPITNAEEEVVVDEDKQENACVEELNIRKKFPILHEWAVELSKQYDRTSP
ncbi:hypothetical protein IV203_018784 [Nitzschia inconspicua]|uniref:Glutathione S-transferase n=1 Tax=Nitzschia inconspicua TaxID=303405 RepID=A0A9K3Q6P2_9STRA|nr:hypothetical protein IV203_018784 [Nitzschia inconspicua]